MIRCTNAQHSPAAFAYWLARTRNGYRRGLRARVVRLHWMTGAELPY